MGKNKNKKTELQTFLFCFLSELIVYLYQLKSKLNYNVFF